MSCTTCKTWRNACEASHPMCIDKFLTKRKPKTAYEIYASTISIECLPIFQKHGYDLGTCVSGYIMREQMNFLEYIKNTGYEFTLKDMNASCSVSVAMTSWLRSCHCEWNDSTYIEACKRRSMEHIKYLYENGCPLNRDVMMGAIRSGVLKYVTYLYDKCVEHGIEMMPELFWETKKNVKIIKFLRDKGLSYPTNYINIIARHGNLEALKYIRETGCEWTDSVCCLIANRNEYDMYVYAHTTGCPVGDGHDYLYVYDDIKTCPYDNCVCKKYAKLSGYIRNLNIPNLIVFDHNKPFSKYDFW